MHSKTEVSQLRPFILLLVSVSHFKIGKHSNRFGNKFYYTTVEFK